MVVLQRCSVAWIALPRCRFKNFVIRLFIWIVSCSQNDVRGVCVPWGVTGKGGINSERS